MLGYEEDRRTIERTLLRLAWMQHVSDGRDVDEDSRRTSRNDLYCARSRTTRDDKREGERKREESRLSF